MLGHRIKYWPSKLLQPYFWWLCTNCIICNFKLVQCYLLCRYNARVVKMAERTVLMTLKTDIAKFEDRSIITFVKPTNAAQLKLATNPHLLLPSPQSYVSQVLQNMPENMLNILWHICTQWLKYKVRSNGRERRLMCKFRYLHNYCWISLEQLSRSYWMF